MPTGYLLEPAFIAAAGGASVIDFVQITSNEETSLTGYELVGGFSFDASEYTESYFRIVASVTSGALTGSVQLYNLTDNVQVTAIAITETTPTATESAELALPAGAKTYEVRILVAGGTTEADKLLLEWAGFRLVS